MKKILLFVLALALGSLTCRAQDDGTLRSRLSRDSILIGDQIEWTIDLQLAPGEGARVSKPGETPVPGVEALGEMSLDTLSQKKGVLNLRGRIILTSFDSGSYALPPLYVLLARTDGTIDTLEYAGPTLAVNTIPIDTATFQPYDIKGQIRYPLTFKEVIPWVGLALLVAALIWLLVRWIRLRRQNSAGPRADLGRNVPGPGRQSDRPGPDGQPERPVYHRRFREIRQTRRHGPGKRERHPDGRPFRQRDVYETSGRGGGIACFSNTRNSSGWNSCSSR